MLEHLTISVVDDEGAVPLFKGKLKDHGLPRYPQVAERVLVRAICQRQSGETVRDYCYDHKTLQVLTETAPSVMIERGIRNRSNNKCVVLGIHSIAAGINRAPLCC